MKIKVLEERLRKLIKEDGWQFGFYPGRLTTEVIFIMRHNVFWRRHSNECQGQQLNGH